MKKAFTLAEIMIVLSVIAIITAILLPSARNAMPNEKIMKFKKGHNTLYTAIVNSDKYYLNGDLGIKADGESLFKYDVDPLEVSGYFCATFADILNAKTTSCSAVNTASRHGYTIYTNLCSGAETIADRINCNGNRPRTFEEMQSSKKGVDNACKKITDLTDYSYHIISNNITYWELNAYLSFGSVIDTGNGVYLRIYSSPNEKPTLYDSFGMDVAYKGFCMDIDGINQGEDPFGYGIRADGKILNGAKADEWLEKSIQNKD